MNRFLFDTNALNAFINRRLPFAHQVQSARQRGDGIGTCEPVVAEMYYGLELSSSRERNVERLERGLSQIRSWPFDRKAAREYGRIAAELKLRGRKMQVVDMMIASIALTLKNCTIVTTDSDLSAIPNLSVVDWMTASDAGKP